jgi:translation initiation factor IF-2
LPGKKRVFQVAREFNVSNEALIAYLSKLNQGVQNQMSLLSDEAYTLVIEKFGEKAAQTDTEYEFRKKLRDKKVQEEEQKEKVRQNLEIRIRYAQELVHEMPELKKQRDTVKQEETAAKKTRDEKKQASESKLEVTAEKPKHHKKKLRIVEIPPEEPDKRAKEKMEKSRPEKPGLQPSGSMKEREKERERLIAKEKERERERAKGKAKPIEAGAGNVLVEKPAAVTTDGEGLPLEDRQGSSHKKRKRKRKKHAEAVPSPQVVPDETVLEHKRKRVKKKKKPVFNDAEINENIRQTLAALDETGKPKKRHKKTAESDTEVEETPIIRVSEFIPLSELAKLMEEEPSELIKKCLDMGMMVSINQRLDMDTITLLASEYGYNVEALEEFGDDILRDLVEENDDDENLKPRPPVVTIMGHVDHGKTSLLDQIRKSNIIAGESGGITQHIGAYEVAFNGRAITFLDTPGHEAFTAMRARGAQVTDIVVLVVAADDSVMPQTIEAISHAKAAGVPIIVAINKIDKPNANPDMIKKQLADHGVLIEQWGGKNQAVEISAKLGKNIDRLLEMILVEADVLDLKANPERQARGVIIESRLDKGKGVVATVLVQNGTLKISDPFIAGTNSGKVRSMFDERGRKVKTAGPSVPVQVLGFDGIPQAGDKLLVLETERDTKDISSKRQQLQREHERWRSRARTLDEISQQIQKGQIRQLSVILKADVDGSIEAITDALHNLSTQEVAVNIIHKGVGAISESDTLLASASGAIIIGFHVRPTTKARELALHEHVDIRFYKVIYDIVDDVKSALEGFLAPHLSEEIVGTIEVRQTFKVPKAGTIAGCFVVSGSINRNSKIKLYREDRLVHEGKISSLKRFKDDVREVSSGFECGIGLENYDDIKVNDVIEVFKVIETKRTL